MYNKRSVLFQKDHIQAGIQCLQLVGDSASECNTVPGRESMASVFFLYGQFEEVLVYLNSIKSHYINDDTFNYNYAQVCMIDKGYYLPV